MGSGEGSLKSTALGYTGRKALPGKGCFRVRLETFGRENLVCGISKYEIDKIMSIYGPYHEEFLKISGLSYEKMKKYNYI